MYHIVLKYPQFVYWGCVSALRNRTETFFFTFSLFPRKDSDVVAPYEKWEYYDGRVKQLEQDRNYALNKTRKVAWFVSNCGARNGRLQYAHELQKHIQVNYALSLVRFEPKNLHIVFLVRLLFCRSTSMDRVVPTSVREARPTNVSTFSIVTTNSIWHLRIPIAKITLRRNSL